MATLNEGRHAGEFIGEHPMHIGYHTDTVTVLSGQVLSAGHVVGIVTASGKYVAYDNAGTDDGRRTVAGILYDNVNATGADKTGVVVRRGPMTVNKNDLVWAAGIDANEQATAIAALLVMGIKAV